MPHMVPWKARTLMPTSAAPRCVWNTACTTLPSGERWKTTKRASEEQEDDGRDDDIVHGENDRAEEKARLRVGPREHEGLVAPFDACSTAQDIADGERHHGEREVGSGEDGLRSAHAA